MKFLPALVLTCGAFAASLYAADPQAAAGSHQLSEFHLGSLITGPDLKLDAAKGKAVLIDEWGIHCGPCLASLPEMEKISKRYKDKMLVFGAHAQDGTDEEVKAVVDKNKLSYTITKGVNGPIQVTGIPHVFIFDTTGKMLFSGSPFDKEFERSLHHALAGSSSGGGTASNDFPFPGH